VAPLHIERAFLGRHKPFHFRIWYRDALAGYVQEMLLDERALTRPHVDRKGLEKVVRTHLQGDGNYTNDIHRLLTVELVYRLFIDERAQRDCEAPPVTETCFLG
jgi:asparagine synthase (glutamine-hydrolysing)